MSWGVKLTPVLKLQGCHNRRVFCVFKGGGDGFLGDFCSPQNHLIVRKDIPLPPPWSMPLGSTRRHFFQGV